MKTIEDLRKAKSELEATISAKIKDFEVDYGIRVKQVTVVIDESEFQNKVYTFLDIDIQ